jgi:tripartite-type tricarboxylate transporter receptor subunit TctC
VARPYLGANWTKTYDPGAVGTSSLTRLAFFGSSTDVNSVAQPTSAAQINNQSIYSAYTDVDYIAGVAQTYYLVVGNLAGNAVTTQNPTVSVTELKR